MMTDEQIFRHEERLLGVGWQAYAEHALGHIVKDGDFNKLIHLRMAFFAGVSHALKLLQHKGMPSLETLFQQLHEQSEQMKEICIMIDDIGQAAAASETDKLL